MDSSTGSIVALLNKLSERIDSMVVSLRVYYGAGWQSLPRLRAAVGPGRNVADGLLFPRQVFAPRYYDAAGND